MIADAAPVDAQLEVAESDHIRAGAFDFAFECECAPELRRGGGLVRRPPRQRRPANPFAVPGGWLKQTHFPRGWRAPFRRLATGIPRPPRPPGALARGQFLAGIGHLRSEEHTSG